MKNLIKNFPLAIIVLILLLVVLVFLLFTNFPADRLITKAKDAGARKITCTNVSRTYIDVEFTLSPKDMDEASYEKHTLIITALPAFKEKMLDRGWTAQAFLDKGITTKWVFEPQDPNK